MKCPLCNEHKNLPYNHPLYRWCNNCGSLYQYKDISQIEDYYSEQKLDYSHQVGSYKNYLQTMLKVLPKEALDYMLIDVGAGDGTFIKTATQFFPIAKGTDRSKKASKILKTKNLWINEEEIANSSPKVITSFQVLEHVPCPIGFINSFNLQPGDYLVLTSPAVDSPTALKIHKKGTWNSLSPSHHLCMFSQKGLEILAEKCNLETIHHSFVFSACHGALDNLKKHIIQYLKWPIKRLIGRTDPFPPFYGKNSFLIIMRQK